MLLAECGGGFLTCHINGRFLKLTAARIRAISLQTPPGALIPRTRESNARRVVDEAMAARDAPAPAMAATMGSFVEADMAVGSVAIIRMSIGGGLTRFLVTLGSHYGRRWTWLRVLAHMGVLSRGPRHQGENPPAIGEFTGRTWSRKRKRTSGRSRRVKRFVQEAKNVVAAVKLRRATRPRVLPRLRPLYANAPCNQIYRRVVDARSPRHCSSAMAAVCRINRSGLSFLSGPGHPSCWYQEGPCVRPPLTPQLI